MPPVITEAAIDAARREGRTELAVAQGAIVTPAAIDRAAQLGIALQRNGGAPAATGPARNGASTGPGLTGRKQQQQLVDFDRVRHVMAAHGLDGIVAAAPHNVFYLSGFDVEPLWEFPWIAQVVVPLHGDPALILSGLDLIQPVEAELWIHDYYPYSMSDMIVFDADSLLDSEREMRDLTERLRGRMSRSNVEAITLALRERGILDGRLGFDDLRLLPRMPVEGLNAVDAIDIMREIRMVKTAPEIALMHAAAQINEASALAAARTIPRSRSWQDVIDVYKTEMIRRGGEAKYMIGGAQHHTGTHQHNHGYQPRRGDFFMVDALGTRHHYYGDFGRTASWGEPPRLVRKRFEAMRRGFEAGIAMARPGVSFTEVNDTVREVIRREGSEHHRVTVTHSVGLEHTDQPRRPGSVVAANMTMNIDIAYLEAGFGALHLEDTFVARETGPELLTSGKTDLIVVG